MLLALSSILLLLGAAIPARALARTAADRYWIALALIAAQMGIAATLASLFRAFTPGGLLIAQAILLIPLPFAARYIREARIGDPHPPVLPQSSALSPQSYGLILVILAALALTATRQAVSPVWDHDEINYHAARIAWWIQHQSIFPYPTHNERQTLFPFGAELVAAWPMLFLREEWAMRMGFWLCFPLGALGLYTLTRALRLSRFACWAAVALWALTPAVAGRAVGLKSDAWLAIPMLGVAYFLARPRSDDEVPWLRYLWAGAFIALAVHVKTTAAALVAPALLLIPFLERAWIDRRRAAIALCAGGALFALASGVALVFAHGLLHHGHPLGPRDLQMLVRPEFDLHTQKTQLVRVPLFLFELPDTLSHTLRERIEAAGQRIAERVGATAVLPIEEPLRYPGRFEYRLGMVARGYSLPGLLWLPLLLVGAAHIARVLIFPRSPEDLDESQRPDHHARTRGITAVTLLAIVALLSVTVGLRWMGGGPNRFWLGAYALAVPVIVYFIARWSERSRLIAALACIGLVWTIYPSLRTIALQTESAFRQPRTPEQLDAPYADLLPHIPPGSTILLIGGNTAREWPLFRPREGLANRIITWAAADFDLHRTIQLLDQHPEITHVLIEHGHTLKPRWTGEEPTAPILQQLRARPDLTELQNPPRAARLFIKTP